MHSTSPFSYASPTQVRFGAGTYRDIIAALPKGAQQVLLVQGASGKASAPVLDCLISVGITVTQMPCKGEPSVPTINAALDDLAGRDIDAVIACGGGAAIDTGKALRVALAHQLRRYDDFTTLAPEAMAAPCALPCIALPTTAGTGAEVTANAVIGVPDKQAKISLRGRALCPDLAIIDPTLMQGSPAHVALHSGLDAVTQIFESHTSNAATPFSLALTTSVMGMGLPALRRIIDGADQAAWHDLAWVSHVSGQALANSGLGAAHGLASVIGGRYDAPHGALCGWLLIPVLRQNLLRAPSGSEVSARIASCIAQIEQAVPPGLGGDPMSGLLAWMQTHNLPRLADWGVKAADLSEIATQGMAASSSQKNAVPLNFEDYLEVLEAAL